MAAISRQPKKPAPVSSSSDWLILIAKIGLVLLILFLLPKLVTGKSSRRLKKEIHSVRSHCQQVTCAIWLPEEAKNCVNFCTSPACYAQVFGANPLEDGEIDIPRSQDYEDCLKEEFRLLRTIQRSGDM